MCFKINHKMFGLQILICLSLLGCILQSSVYAKKWVPNIITKHYCSDPDGSGCPTDDKCKCASCAVDLEDHGQYVPYCKSYHEGQCVSDPVVLGSGEYVVGGSDMSVELGGVSLGVRRSYSNQSDRGNDGVGYRWGLSLLDRVEEQGEDSVTLIQDGAPKIIEKSGDAYITDNSYTLTKVNGKFVLEQINGFKFYYDDNHNVVSHVSKYGPYYNWVYDGNQNVRTVQYKGAKDVLYVDWDDEVGVVTKITNALTGGSVVYEYSEAGDLTHITGACGSCSTSKAMGYDYDNDHNITAVKNADGVTMYTNMYDESNRVTSQVYQASLEGRYVRLFSICAGNSNVYQPRGNGACILPG